MKWTEAGQVAEALGWAAPDGGLAQAAPEAYFRVLREAGRLDEAAMFLGQALPRYEAVAWAAMAVRDGAERLDPAEEQPLKATLLWLQDTSEARRRAAFAGAQAAQAKAPARFAALAAFFSGGSMAPEGVAPVPAPKDATGRFAAAAVILAADRTRDRAAALNRALDAGVALAVRGAEAR